MILRRIGKRIHNWQH